MLQISRCLMEVAILGRSQLRASLSMVSARRFGWTVPSTLATGSTARQMAKALFTTLTAMSLTDTSELIRRTAMECISTRPASATQANGRMMYSRALELKPWQTVASTKGTFTGARSMVEECTSGSTGLTIMVNGATTKSMATAFMYGLMVGAMRAPGGKISSIIVAFTPGRMAAATMVSTSMTKSMAGESTSGQTASVMKAIGIMENSTDRDGSRTRLAKAESDFGSMETGSSGCLATSLIFRT